jgi:hypothetical protein
MGPCDADCCRFGCLSRRVDLIWFEAFDGGARQRPGFCRLPLPVAKAYLPLTGDDGRSCHGRIRRARAKYGRAVFEYVLRPVGGETGRFVEEIWFARGRITGVRERIAPTGSTVAAFVLGDPILQTPVGQGIALLADTGFLIGPHDRPIVNEPQGETYCVGIVTTPVGCRPTLGLAPATLRGRIVDLLQAWPKGRRPPARAVELPYAGRGP